MSDIRKALEASKLLYETDEHAWKQEQIAILESGLIEFLDSENVARLLTEMSIREKHQASSVPNCASNAASVSPRITKRIICSRQQGRTYKEQ
jgi:hypothetical protein